MSVEFKLPDLGEGIHEAEILAVKVKEGDTVAEDQAILEVETDKAVVEIPCPVAGVVEKVHVAEGDIVTVGTVMITFRVEAESKQEPEPAAGKKQDASPVTSKSAPQVSAPKGVALDGRASELKRSGPIPATPATRRMAREMGVDLKLVRATGPAGRVLKEDVRAFAEGVVGSALSGTATIPSGPSQAGGSRTHRGAPQGPARTREPAEPFVAQPLVAQPVELPNFEKYGPVERVPLRSIRRKIALNMTQSWSHIPHVTHFDEADVTQLDEFLKKNEKRMLDRGVRLTLTVFMVKAVVMGLRQYPQFNSSLDESTGEIIHKHFYNVGIAVATERGLIVPVIRDADQKTLNQIAGELADIAQKTREGKIELERLQGGTFTITNSGAIGGTGMVPIVNFPEAAILGMARASQKPVIRNGNIQPATLLPLALSFDHRIADGAEAAYFVRHVAGCLEEPLQLLLED